MSDPTQKTTAIKTLETTRKVRPMIKEWAQKTHEAQSKGEPIVYYFVISLYEDILRAMDILSTGTENYAGICAAKMDYERFLDKAQTEGFASYLCSYASCWVGYDAMFKELGGVPPNAPDGGLARPTLMLGTGMMICDPRYKGFQASRRYTRVPMHVHNLLIPPVDANLANVETYYVKFIAEELAELVEFLEKYTNRRMDWSRLIEVIDLIEKTQRLWWEAYALRRTVPCPMPTEDAMTVMVPGCFYMGTEQAYAFYKELYEEIQYRANNRIGVIPEEKYRLLWGGGIPPWFALKLFNYVESLGAVFTIETTYHPPPPVEIPNGVNNPLERIALRFFRQNTYRYQAAQMHTGSPDVEWLLELINDYKIDGVVFHQAHTCRTVHTGQLHQIKKLKHYKDIPTLILEGDIVDKRYYNEQEAYNKLQSFIDIIADYER